MNIYCCACEGRVNARLTNGLEIYPHRPDLQGIPFWICDACGNSVGCHYKTKNPTAPLGNIATPEIKKARSRIHRTIDPIWRSGRISRRQLYKQISKAMGWQYHTAKVRSLEEANRVIEAVEAIERRLR